MYHQDWLMRQIESITRYVFSLILGKGSELTSDYHLESSRPTEADTGKLAFRLAALMREERLCEAEDLLFFAVEAEEPEALTAGLRFYNDLNQLSDETLQRCNFPRDEIRSGLVWLCDAYGIDLSLFEE